MSNGDGGNFDQSSKRTDDRTGGQLIAEIRDTKSSGLWPSVAHSIEERVHNLECTC